MLRGALLKSSTLPLQIPIPAKYRGANVIYPRNTEI